MDGWFGGSGFDQDHGKQMLSRAFEDCTGERDSCMQRSLLCQWRRDMESCFTAPAGHSM